MLIFTDGGCSGNPGPGGWAYVIVEEDAGSPGGPGGVVVEEKWGADGNTTNNRMELMAVISALEAVSAYPPARELKVFTDSQYVQKGMSLWIKGWKARGWKTAGREPVKNTDLWQRLDDLARNLPVTWHWVKGHGGNKYNERCDSLTQKAIASLR